MENVFEQLAQVLSELQAPESRRRRHLRRRLAGLSDDLLHAAIEELFMALVLDAQLDAADPLQALLYEVWRRSEGAEDVKHAHRHIGSVDDPAF